MAAKLDPLMRTGVANIQKWEWLVAFEKAHDEVFYKENIQGGFCGTGIYPYNPDKVINCVSIPATPAPQNRPITPPPANTPFNDNVITSSPMDMEAIRFANYSLNNIIASNTSIQTPVRKYVKSVTRTNERLHARIAIVEREKEDISAALTARRAQKSGRRRVTSGEHLLTTVEMFNNVIAMRAIQRYRNFFYIFIFDRVISYQSDFKLAQIASLEGGSNDSKRGPMTANLGTQIAPT